MKDLPVCLRLCVTTSLTTIKKLQVDVATLKSDMKRVKDILELSDVVDPLKWKDLTDLDRAILQNLLDAGFAGMNTPRLAAACGLKDPGKTGRVKIWHRLKRLQKISYKIRGGHILILETRRWRMNWEDFSFIGYPKPQEAGGPPPEVDETEKPMIRERRRGP